MKPYNKSKEISKFPEEIKPYLKSKEWMKINLYLLQNRYFTQKIYNKKYEVEVKNEPLLMELLENKPVSFSIEQSSPHENVNHYIEEQLEAYKKRNEELISTFLAHNMYKTKFDGRVILGEGGLTPFSNVVQLKLHPLYGFPYIPASSIKGGLRACWHDLYVEKEPEDANEKQIEVQLFGTAEDDGLEGKLVFFDAFPTEFTLTKDIETPHFSDYYTDTKNRKQPTDDRNPTPITIICMENVTLPIPLACRDQVLWGKEESRIKDAMKTMITEYGIGAKTALGYGMGTLLDGNIIT